MIIFLAFDEIFKINYLMTNFALTFTFKKKITLYLKLRFIYDDSDPEVEVTRISGK